jgi:hypothetical protein
MALSAGAFTGCTYAGNNPDMAPGLSVMGELMCLSGLLNAFSNTGWKTRRF